ITGVLIVSMHGFVMTLIMQKDPYGGFYNFLNILAYLVVPFSTILLLDYYLRMRKHSNVAVKQLFDAGRRFEWGFVAWVAACFVTVPFWSSTMFTGPLATVFAGFGDITYLIGVLAAVILFLILRKLPTVAGAT